MKKSSIASAAIVIASVATLSACGHYDVDKVAAMPDNGGAFEVALHKTYVERAKFEVGQGDWTSVDFFNRRAELAAEGKAPIMRSPEDRGLAFDRDDVSAAHARLWAAMSDRAAERNPEACAEAQARLEHWMEQLEEGHQADHIAEERAGYEKSIPVCESRPEGSPMTVFFDLDSDELTPQAAAVIGEIASKAGKFHPVAVEVAGYADRSGGFEHNHDLGKRRMMTVANALRAKGVNVHIVGHSQGEMENATPTADGTVSVDNRRVTVTFMGKNAN